jgi:hypothetical protein
MAESKEDGFTETRGEVEQRQRRQRQDRKRRKCEEGVRGRVGGTERVGPIVIKGLLSITMPHLV